MVRKILTKNLFILKILTIVLIVFIGAELVIATEIENPGTAGDEKDKGTLGGGSWSPSTVGLKISIISNSGQERMTQIILNNRGNIGKKFSIENSPKFLQSNPILWDAKNPPKNTSSIIPNNWYVGDKSIDINNLLTKSNYSNLKTLIKNFFNISLNSDDWIFVEPMTAIGNCYGTAYELATSFFSISSFRYDYQKAVFGGNSNNPKGGVFYNSIYLNTVQNLKSSPFSNFTVRPEGNVDEQNKCFTNKFCGAGIGIYKVSDIYPELNKAKLTINKINSVNKRMITSSATTFEIYNSTNCSGKLVKTVKTSGGRTSIELDKGTYSVKEVGVPSGYEKPKDSCVIKNITLNLGDNKTQTVTNEPNCNTRLADLGSNPSKYSLNNLYKLYPKLNGLLNFRKPSCTAVSCNYSKNVSCLSGNFGNLTFNSDNVSCYNEKIDVNGNTGYCLTTFNLVNKLGSTNFFAKSGMMPISKDTLDTAIAATGTINKKCLVLGSKVPNSANIGKYSEYVSNVKFDNRNLYVKKDSNKVSDSDKTLTKVNQSGSWYEYSHSVNYYLNEIYATNIKGEINYNKCNNCKFLGYGIISKLADSGVKDIPFSISFSNTRTDKLKYENKDYTNKCKVTLTPELVVGKCDPKKEKCDNIPDNPNGNLNLQFRLIDSFNPFPGKGGNGRKVGSNWCSGTNCKNDNDLIKNIISNRTNSYGKIPSTGQNKNPIYRITLTPDTIRKIREYNEKHQYDDYTLKCDSDGNNCKSTFLEKFKITRLN